MKITNPITLDVARSNSYVCLVGKQFDSNSRFLEITLTNNGQPLPIPAGASAVLRATRADGTGALVSGTVNSGRATVEIDDYILEVNGAVTLSLEISKDGETLTTPSCNLTVQKADASGWIRVYVADSSKAAGNYYITIGGVSYSFTTSQAIPAGGSVYFSANNATAETRDATGTVIETGLVLTQGATGTELVSDVPAISFLAALLANKADIDGSYENLTAGNAEQLVSSVGINDKVPYIYRTTGGSVDVGTRKEEKIIGGSFVWNQLASYDATDWSRQRANVSFSGTKLTVAPTVDSATQKSVYFAITPNHKYYIATTLIYAESTYGCSVGIYNGTPNGGVNPIKRVTISLGSITEDYPISMIVDAGATGTVFGINQGTSAQSTQATVFKNLVVFDLTLMLGPTIADYINTLETGNAGAGVAFFKKLFPKPFYSYNTGELLSVKTSKAVMTGFNQYDHTTGKARVIGGNQYQICGTYSSLSLDGTAITPDGDGHFTPATCGEITVTGGNGTDTCIHLVWDGERDDEWEEYTTYEYPLDSTLELRGVPRLDANNDLYYDGDVYKSDGNVTRKYAVIDMGNLSWTYHSDGYFYAAPTDGKVRFTGTNPQGIVCGRYVYDGECASISDAAAKIDKSIAQWKNSGGLNRVSVKDSAYTDAPTFTTAVTGVYLVYELETPAEETAYPYTDPMIVNDWGTEEFVDSRTVPIPVGHDTFYQANLRAKLEMAPNSPSGDGDYIVRQTSGVNEYIPIASNSAVSGLLTRVPEAPATNGTYVLKATVSGGVKTYSWVAE